MARTLKTKWMITRMNPAATIHRPLRTDRKEYTRTSKMCCCVSSQCHTAAKRIVRRTIAAAATPNISMTQATI